MKKKKAFNGAQTPTLRQHSTPDPTDQSQAACPNLAFYYFQILHFGRTRELILPHRLSSFLSSILMPGNPYS